MTCETTLDILPWYLNRTLPDDERARVEAHLEDCESCRRELRATALAGEIFGQHLPAETLVDLAFDRPLDDAERELAERHLETCRRCAEELELARESRRLSETEETPMPATVVPFRRPQPVSPVWRYAAMAAALAGLLLGAGWVVTFSELDEGRSAWAERESALLADAEARQAELRSELEALRRELAAGTPTGASTTDAGEPRTGELLDAERQRAAELADRVAELEAELEAPRLNVQIADLYPTDLIQRNGEENQPEVPAAAENVVFNLVYDGEDAYPDYEIELADAAGRSRWSRRGLELDPDSGFVFSLGRERLPEGGFSFRVYGRRGEARNLLAEYRVKLR